MNRSQELDVKLERVRRWLAERRLSGVLLSSRANFAWITAGGQSYVSQAGESGVGQVLITPDRLILLADNIEAVRLAEEELGPILAERFEVVEFPWHDLEAGAATLNGLTGGKAIAGDVAGSAINAAAELTELRTPLVESEIERYRELGCLTSETTERICRSIEQGMSEHDVAGMVVGALAPHGVRVPVCLIAADERLLQRRHPIPKLKPIERRVMVVVCAEREGLWVNLTRLVNFEPLDSQTTMAHRAVCQVDVAANAATKPGRTLGDVFHDLVAEYERQGFGDQWKLHHQGGSTGYNGRDVFARPGCPAFVRADQAFAWNPSITGTKSEDTVLVRADGAIEFISRVGADWPAIEIERDGVTFRRADILTH